MRRRSVFGANALGLSCSRCNSWCRESNPIFGMSSVENILQVLLGVGKQNVFEKPVVKPAPVQRRMYGEGAASDVEETSEQGFEFKFFPFSEMWMPVLAGAAIGAAMFSPALGKFWRAYKISWYHPRSVEAINRRSLNKIQSSTKGVAPTLGSNVFVAHNALVRGVVSFGSNSSVWYNGFVVSDDLHPIVIGSNVHLKEHSVAQSSPDSPLTIGDAVEIGAHSTVTGCTLQGHNIVGTNSHVCEGAVLEAGAVVAPYSVVPAGTKVGADELWAGVPAVKVRALSTTEIAVTRASIQRTSVLAQEHGVESNKSIGEVLNEADEHFVGQLEHPLEKDRPIPL